MTSLSSMRSFKRKNFVVALVATLVTLQIRTFLQVHHHDDVGATREDSADIVVVPDAPADIRENNNTHLLLKSYDPALHPVMSRTKKSLPLRVAIVTINPLRGEAMHFLYDGVMHSSHLSLVGMVSLYGGDLKNATTAEGRVVPIASAPDLTNVDLWLVDGQHVAKLNNRPLWKEILKPQASHSVLFVDFSDRFAFQRRHYAKLGVWKMMQKQDGNNIRLAVRSIVEGRMFDAEQKATHPAGHVAPNPFGTLHFPYAVRSDIVHVMLQELRSKHPNDALWSSIASPAYADDEESLRRIQEMLFDATAIRRSMHVYHPWQVTTKKGQSELRNSVSRLVRSWNGISLYALGEVEQTATTIANVAMQQHQQIPLNTSIREAGARMDQGRNSVDPSYIRALMQAKIVIVAQRDGWEDHYRFFEAMVCGPLVISDRMIAPPKGIVDGETVVFFDNSTHLQQLISYYLTHDEEREQIAKTGWMLAATRHRSWHRLEELFL